MISWRFVRLLCSVLLHILAIHPPFSSRMVLTSFHRTYRHIIGHFIGALPCPLKTQAAMPNARRHFSQRLFTFGAAFGAVHGITRCRILTLALRHPSIRKTATRFRRGYPLALQLTPRPTTISWKEIASRSKRRLPGSSIASCTDSAIPPHVVHGCLAYGKVAPRASPRSNRSTH